MPRHMRLKVLVSLAVGVAAVFTVPALGNDSGLVPLGTWGSGDEVGPHIESIAATEDGSIVVADRKRDRVVRFTYAHALAGSFPATDPRGIAAVPGGGYLVSEPGAYGTPTATGRLWRPIPPRIPTAWRWPATRC